MMDGNPLTRTIFLEEFAPLVDSALLADCDPRPVTLYLVSATPLVDHAKLGRPPFLLIFRSAPDALLVAGHYVLRGKNFGPDQVQLSQISNPAGSAPGHYYQAVFN